MEWFSSFDEVINLYRKGLALMLLSYSLLHTIHNNNIYKMPMTPVFKCVKCFLLVLMINNIHRYIIINLFLHKL